MLKFASLTHCLLFLWLPLQGLIAQTTAIPDSVFENALIKLGFDFGAPDGMVLTANINEVSRLDLRGFSGQGEEITDMTGIEDFERLEYLNVDFHQVAILDVSKNLLLTELHCHGNMLTSLSLAQNIRLEKVICEYNAISNLDLSNNPNLEVLRCGGNKLQGLDLSENTKLIELDYHMNEITSIDLSNNLELLSLHSSRNQLTELDISKNTKLEGFNCSHNFLSSIDVSQSKRLAFFGCDSNEIKTLDLSQNEILKSLYCQDNKITNIKFPENSSLKALRCWNNELTHLDLSNAPLFFDLFCSNNKLICLNVKNGNNHQMANFSAANNPMLDCIEVDDSAFSTSTWLDVDPGVSFHQFCGNECNVVATDFVEEFAVKIFPNPSDQNISISFGKIVEGGAWAIYDLNGKEILSESFSSRSTLDLELPQNTGLYFLQISTSSGLNKGFRILKK